MPSDCPVTSDVPDMKEGSTNKIDNYLVAGRRTDQHTMMGVSKA